MKIDFIKTNKITFPLSLIFCFLSIFLVYTNGLNLGLEFTGGIEIEIESKEKMKIDMVKNTFKSIGNAKIKYYGSKKNIQIKIKSFKNNVDDIIISIEKVLDNQVKIIRVDYIGAEVNDRIIKKSIIAIISAFIFMMLYLSFRFKYKFAISATLTLIHDIVLIIGLISLLKLEFDLAILSAIFAVFGYSINDTVVIFDRIRENLIIYENKYTFEKIINISVNNSLSRTIITSLSTLFVVLILMFFSSEYLLGFSIVLAFGIIIGTYSSIYIATILLTILKNNSKQDNHLK